MLAHACKDVFGVLATSLMLLWTFCKNHAVPVSKNTRSTVEVYKTFIVGETLISKHGPTREFEPNEMGEIPVNPETVSHRDSAWQSPLDPSASSMFHQGFVHI
jgi:hypothetical protein